MGLVPDRSRHVIQVARPAGALRRWSRRRHPGWEVEVKELRHVDLRRIPIRQRCKVEPGLNQLQDRGVISNVVVHVVLPGVRRYHDNWNSKPGIGETAGRSIRSGADISRQQVDRPDSIGTHSLLRGDMVVETSSLVERENES